MWLCLLTLDDIVDSAYALHNLQVMQMAESFSVFISRSMLRSLIHFRTVFSLATYFWKDGLAFLLSETDEFCSSGSETDRFSLDRLIYLSMFTEIIADGRKRNGAYIYQSAVRMLPVDTDNRDYLIH